MSQSANANMPFSQQASWATRKQALWLHGEAELWATKWKADQGGRDEPARGIVASRGDEGYGTGKNG